MSFLNVSEHFRSVQGEGPSAGRQSVFLRLAGCNFSCSWCDSVDVWKTGTRYTELQLLTLFEKEGYIDAMRDGAHFILTGGNPLLKQRNIIDFLLFLQQKHPLVTKFLHVEVETQGDMSGSALASVVSNLSMYDVQWNVSPKLANSGMPKDKRIVPDALRWFVGQPVYSFKFPTYATAEEMSEIEEIRLEFNIPHRRIWLMPICSTRDELSRRSDYIVNTALAYGYNYSPRLQLLIWDKTTGV